MHENYVEIESVESIEAEIKAKEEADAIKAELQEKADVQKETEFYQKCYDEKSDLNDDIAGLREKLKADISELKNASWKRTEKIIHRNSKRMQLHM